MQPDQELISQFKQSIHREQAFTHLMQKHQVKAYHQIKRMVQNHADADDIAQLVWIKVWNKLDGFKMESEFSTWLFRIAYNETLNFISKQKHISQPISMDEMQPLDYLTSSTDGPKNTEIQIKLERGVKQLPEKQRFVFMLRYFDECTYENISKIMGTTVGGAKANFHQAAKKIEEFLKNS